MKTVEQPFQCVVCEAPTQHKGELCDTCESEVRAEEAKTLSNLKKMIRTANKAVERQGYDHGEIELAAIARVMDAVSMVSTDSRGKLYGDDLTQFFSARQIRVKTAGKLYRLPMNCKIKA
ncbi:hypothetical protein ACFOQM_09650 [Paenibacillus sp. GCM10012307]|uniref:Uncharacterized protein n=1 Tax=Paenibacillus roseus TaxID=2798579 RepID=A0A934J4J4_9BACL|nr:hypothetical protein [Paenibacillus roseus]MBJ6361549.1 hypothetical protein [Paenibacillus roseus]